MLFTVFNMRSSKLFTVCLFALSLSAIGCNQKAEPDAITSAPSVTAYGSIKTMTSSGGACAWTVDGKSYGTNTGFTTVLSVGFHPVTCSRASDGFVSTQNVTVIESKTTDVKMWLPAPPPPPAPTGKGELVAVAVGGSCTFAVNGASKGTSAQLKLELWPGTYSVSCKPASGSQKTRSVIIKPGETAMAMFKLDA